MITVYRGNRWKISVYGRDHGAPHFHIEGAGFRCSVAIGSLTLIVGTAPTAIMRAALAWARSNQDELSRVWRELNGRELNG
jgi:hypothetical protein